MNSEESPNRRRAIPTERGRKMQKLAEIWDVDVGVVGCSVSTVFLPGGRLTTVLTEHPTRARDVP